MKHIAIFASGGGTNAEAIIGHFKNDPEVEISLIVSNNADAFVLERARNHSIPSIIINRKEFRGTEQLLDDLNSYNIDLIVLAGFMWLVPEYLVKAYENRMVNIHPTLLPKYGGKGIYGMNAHSAVKAVGESETGITIHWVNEHYDEGGIILQKSCMVDPDDSPEQIAEKVHLLEYEYYPQVIESIIKNN